MNEKTIESPFQFLRNDITNIKFKNKLYIAPNDATLSRRFDIDYKIGEIKTENDKKYAVIGMFFNMIIEENETNEELLNFDLDLEGLFCAPADTTDDLFKAALELNGLTALYGVARGHISTISSSVTGIERITLPMINIKNLVDLRNSNRNP